MRRLKSPPVAIHNTPRIEKYEADELDPGDGVTQDQPCHEDGEHRLTNVNDAAANGCRGLDGDVDECLAPDDEQKGKQQKHQPPIDDVGPMTPQMRQGNWQQKEGGERRPPKCQAKGWNVGAHETPDDDVAGKEKHRQRDQHVSCGAPGQRPSAHLQSIPQSVEDGILPLFENSGNLSGSASKMKYLSLPFIPSMAETLEFCITTGYPFRHA